MSPLAVLGSWTLERRIDDRHAGERLRVSGTTELSAAGPDRVDWHEEGLLHRPGHRAAAVHRTLRVVRRGGAGGPGGPGDSGEEDWWVLFDHGGDFHRWSPGVSVVHPCGADVYRGRVDLAGLPGGWQVTWEVTGPAKDYTMLSTLTRV